MGMGEPPNPFDQDMAEALDSVNLNSRIWNGWAQVWKMMTYRIAGIDIRSAKEAEDMVEYLLPQVIEEFRQGKRVEVDKDHG